MGLFAFRDLAELVDEMRRRRPIRITHPEVDNVFATPAGLRLQIVDDVEDVRWKPFNAGKFVHRFDYKNTGKICMENAAT